MSVSTSGAALIYGLGLFDFEISWIVLDLDFGCCFCFQIPAFFFYLLQLYLLTFLTLVNTLVFFSSFLPLIFVMYMVVGLSHVYASWGYVDKQLFGR